MFKRFLSIRITGKHTCNLCNTLLALYILNGRRCFSAFNSFSNLYLIIGINCNAREMRYTENLTIYGKSFHMPAESSGNFSADTGINFIKDKRFYRVNPGKNRFYRKHNA